MGWRTQNSVDLSAALIHLAPVMSSVAMLQHHHTALTEPDAQQEHLHQRACLQNFWRHHFAVHRERVKNMRPAIDTTPPEDFTHFQYNAKRAMQQAERLYEIDRVRSAPRSFALELLADSHSHATQDVC